MSGTTALVDVYRYAEPITKKGLGLHGRSWVRPHGRHGTDSQRRQSGGVYYRSWLLLCRQASPSIKIAANTAMYQRMRDDII